MDDDVRPLGSFLKTFAIAQIALERPRVQSGKNIRLGFTTHQVCGFMIGRFQLSQNGIAQ